MLHDGYTGRDEEEGHIVHQEAGDPANVPLLYHSRKEEQQEKHQTDDPGGKGEGQQKGDALGDQTDAEHNGDLAHDVQNTSSFPQTGPPGNPG